MSTLSVFEVSKHFGGINAVSKVSFEVKPGEALAFIGPNAAGKTTLLNLISGWQKPDEGYVSVEGQIIHQFYPENFASHGLVRTFQRTRLFYKQTVLNNLLLACCSQRSESLRGSIFARKQWLHSQREEGARAEGILETLGISHLRDKPAYELSGGEQRLVELSVAAMRKPRILILDEPVANLSQEARQKVAAFVSEQRKAGVACIFVEHDLTFVRQVANRVLVLVQGRVFGVGESTSSFTRNIVEEAYLSISQAIPQESSPKVYNPQRINRLTSLYRYALKNITKRMRDQIPFTIEPVGIRINPQINNQPTVMPSALPSFIARQRERSNPALRYDRLTVRQLSVEYEHGSVLQNVSFDVCPGEITALVGGNGAGKSTAIRAILGLVRYKGSIKLGEIPFTSLSTHAINQCGVAYVPQQRKVFPSLTVLENLLVAENKANSKSFERVIHAFPELKDSLDGPAGMLSGGQQQMVAFARAILQNPRLLLLDEPSAGLSEPLWQRLVNLLRELAREGLPMLIVEHRPAAIKGIQAKGYLIRYGKITAQGPWEELSSQQSLQDNFLGFNLEEMSKND